ncbi:hypothetical protein Tco_0188327, partial [Tanacetum coccineum]
MLVHSIEDEGAISKRPSEPQPTPSPPHPKVSGGNHGGQSSSDKSLSGNEGRGYHQKDRKPSQNDKTEHGMEKTVQKQDQMGPQSITTAHLCAFDKDCEDQMGHQSITTAHLYAFDIYEDCEDFEDPILAQLQPISAI